MPKTILLADDSLTIQRVVTLTFANEDVTITSVSDGDQAVESISRKKPDLVLADIAMPGRSGYQVAEFVRSRPELSSLPVLLLAGAFDHIDEAHVRTVGADGVLTKPFEPKALIGQVKQLLASGRPEPVAAAEPEPPKAVGAIEAYTQEPAALHLPTPATIERAFSVLVNPVVSAPSAAPAPSAPVVESVATPAPEVHVESPAAAAEPVAAAVEHVAEIVAVPEQAVAEASEAAASVDAAAVADVSVVAEAAAAEPAIIESVATAVPAVEPVTEPVVEPVLEAAEVRADAPADTAPVVEPVADAQAAITTRPQSPDTYFEQIDQAFAALAKAPRPSLNLVPKLPTSAPVVEESRDEAIAAVVEPKLATFTAALKAAEAPARTIPLSDAFNALLDAERAGVVDTTVRLSGVPALSPVDVNALADQVMKRVIEQMTDRVVRETVTEIVSKTAERLVREEIEQVKRNIT